MTQPVPRPYRAARTVHETGSAWRQTITDGTIPIARALGVTRSHAMANAASVIRAMRMAEKLDAIMATPASDLEEFAKVIWLKERLQ